MMFRGTLDELLTLMRSEREDRHPGFVGSHTDEELIALWRQRSGNKDPMSDDQARRLVMSLRRTVCLKDQL